MKRRRACPTSERAIPAAPSMAAVDGKERWTCSLAEEVPRAAARAHRPPAKERVAADPGDQRALYSRSAGLRQDQGNLHRPAPARPTPSIFDSAVERDPSERLRTAAVITKAETAVIHFDSRDVISLNSEATRGSEQYWLGCSYQHGHGFRHLQHDLVVTHFLKYVISRMTLSCRPGKVRSSGAPADEHQARRARSEVLVLDEPLEWSRSAGARRDDRVLPHLGERGQTRHPGVTCFSGFDQRPGQRSQTG